MAIVPKLKFEQRLTLLPRHMYIISKSGLHIMHYIMQLDSGGRKAEATVEFTMMMDKFFDIMNV